MSNNEFLCFFRKSSIAFCASGLLAKGLLNDFFISASIVFLSFSMFFITLFSGSLPLITINRSIFPCTGFIKLCALYLAALLDFSFSQQQYFTNWIRKSSIPITISNIYRKV